MTVTAVKQDLKSLRNPERARQAARYFQTKPGGYGEGDIFLGLTVPQQRQIAKKFRDLPLGDVQQLLQSAVHEHRLTALVILVTQYQKTTAVGQKKIYDLYLKNTKYVNNWDLVDTATPKIIGAYLLDKPEKRKVLYRFAKSKNLWERRIAIMATFAFIKEGEFTDTLKLAEALLTDEHDLIHKAVGWMLREVGKKDQEAEEKFLKKHYKEMPRTMLRYAIEKFPEKKRQFYLKK